MSPKNNMVLTEDDINAYNYDVRDNFAENIISHRERMSVDDFDLLSGMEEAAGERCFGYGRRHDISHEDEILDITLYGERIDVRSIIEYIGKETTLKISELSFFDDGWKPACVVVTLVEPQTDTVWA